jgi:hypothetical protein
MALIERPEVDPDVAELRRALGNAKLEALSSIEGLDESGMSLVMPGLYQQIVVTTVRIASLVGTATGLALEAWDEFVTGASISSFRREARQQMTTIGVELKKKHTSRIAHRVAEIEAQRLAWRHGHEFLSWLAFRRHDPRNTPEDRRERIAAFKLVPRLLQSREAVMKLVGAPMCVALEGHDRFMLANRWRLVPNVEHAIEAQAWSLLSYQSASTVNLELARAEYDTAFGLDTADPTREPTLAEIRQRIASAFVTQLAEAVESAPDDGVPLR